MGKRIVIYHCGDKTASKCSGNCKACPHLGDIEIIDPNDFKKKDSDQEKKK